MGLGWEGAGRREEEEGGDVGGTGEVTRGREDRGGDAVGGYRGGENDLGGDEGEGGQGRGYGGGGR